MPTTMSRVTATKIDETYSGATAGQAPGVIASPANGDLIPISSGSGTLLMFQTTGTGTVVTIANVVAPPYGTGGSVTVTCAATDFQTFYVDNTSVDRFDQGAANAGFASLSYTSVTGLTVRAITIP
jgi:hypothetical protein